MYFLGLLLYIVFLIFFSLLSGTIATFIDFPSLLIILALTIPVLMSSGLLSDFFRGFALMGKKINYYSSIDLKRILEADRLAIRALLLAGAVGTIIGTVALLAKLDDPSLFGPSLSVALITVLYSLILISIILPVKAKVSTILETLGQEQNK